MGTALSQTLAGQQDYRHDGFLLYQQLFHDLIFFQGEEPLLVGDFISDDFPESQIKVGNFRTLFEFYCVRMSLAYWFDKEEIALESAKEAAALLKHSVAEFFIRA